MIQTWKIIVSKGESRISQRNHIEKNGQDWRTMTAEVCSWRGKGVKQQEANGATSDAVCWEGREATVHR